MKRVSKFLAALLVVAMCMSTFAMVALAAQKVYTTGSCNIRTGPGLGYASKGTIPSGKTATYQGSRKMDGRGVYWLKVKYNGKTGWVSTRYAHLKGSSYYYYEEDDYDYYDYDDGDYVRTTARVNIRKKASSSSTKLGTVAKGKKLTYRGMISTDYKGNAWYAVRYNGMNAWVSALYSYIM